MPSQVVFHSEAFMELAPVGRIAELKHQINLLKLDQKRLIAILESPDFRDSVKDGAKANLRRTIFLIGQSTEDLNRLETQSAKLV
jgi:hypothetical protein